MTEATWHTHTQVELYPPQMSCVEVLILSTSEWNLIWRQGLYRDN